MPQQRGPPWPIRWRKRKRRSNARRARGAGDLQHATELDVLSLTWAQVASDLLRTAEAEKKLADLQKQVVELEQKAVRTQALIEQTIARRGRAEQNLSNAEAAKPQAKTAPGKAAGSKAPPKPATAKPAKAGSKD